MENIIFKNENYKMIKVDENKYNILDLKDNDRLVLALEGNFSKGQLEEQFNNCLKSCIII